MAISDIEPLAELTLRASGIDAPPIERILGVVRSQLGMELAFLSVFVSGLEVFRAVDGDALSFGLETGVGLPLEDTYSARMVEGELPNLLADVARDPRARELPITEVAEIGAYVGVPLRLWDGRLYGTLCCLAHEPQPTLNERDVDFLRSMSLVIAERLERQEIEGEMLSIERQRIRSVLERGKLSVVLQPIYDLQEKELVGFEALARFEGGPERPPSAWFEAAESVGLGSELELAAVRAALTLLEQLPDGTSLAINVSPAVASSDEFFELIQPVARRAMVEVTEHARVDDYKRLESALRRLKEHGARIAVDDVGAGFASLRHILGLSPDIVKLDLSLTRDIHDDPARRALAASLVGFARDIDATIAAEGIESSEQLALLCELGIDYGQGFYLGPPQPLLAALTADLSLN